MRYKILRKYIICVIIIILDRYVCAIGHSTGRECAMHLMAVAQNELQQQHQQ